MSAPIIEHLQYRDPHPEDHRGGWTVADLEKVRGQFWDVMMEQAGILDGPYSLFRRPAGHSRAMGRPGWHGPLTVAALADHETYERDTAERRHAAHIAVLAHAARRAANPMWQRINEAIDDHGDSSLDAECATDAVMDVVYGEGRW